MSDLERIAWRLARQRDAFLNPETKGRAAMAPSPPPKGHRVVLIVRQGRLRPDTPFIFDSDKISRLEARIEAEQAARAAGWPIIGRVHEVVAR